MHRSAASRTSSAKPFHPHMPITRSPTPNPLTPDPTATTSPATSAPGAKGGAGLNWYSPLMMSTSGKFTPAARTPIFTCPAPGDSDGTSSSTSFSGGPYSLHSIAFIAGLLVGGELTHNLNCARLLRPSRKPRRLGMLLWLIRRGLITLERS